MGLLSEAFRQFYRAPDGTHWRGRKSSVKWPNQYFHEVVMPTAIDDLIRDEYSVGEKKIALLGYACDEGVSRNFGRVGSSDGPIQIRNHLGKLPVHFDNCQIYDVGDVICRSNEMETSQAVLSQLVKRMLDHSIFPIVLGGSHDLSYGHVNGLLQAIGKGANDQIGMINFDAHFDLRKKDREGNSGTPFYQLLQENPDSLKYCVVGIQEQSNTQELFATAQGFDVDYILSSDCTGQPNVVEDRVLSFLDQQDHIYISVDMDGFSSGFAPGVSAPSPFGLSPDFVSKLLSSILTSSKVIACDVAELNPKYDLDGRTASLAAQIVNLIIHKHSLV